MPRTKKDNELIRQNSIKVIKHAALQLFSERGFNGVTIQEIAGRAKVSKGLVYNYFDSKEALFHALIHESFEISNPIMNVLMEKKAPPFERLEMLCSEILRFFKTNLEFWRLLTSLMLHPDVISHMPAEAMERKAEMMDAYMLLMKEIGFEKPLQETILLTAVMDGIGLQMMVAGPEHPGEQLMQEYLEKLKNQLR